jgi:hypothetical protein
MEVPGNGVLGSLPLRCPSRAGIYRKSTLQAISHRVQWLGQPKLRPIIARIIKGTKQIRAA